MGQMGTQPGIQGPILQPFTELFFRSRHRLNRHTKLI